MNKQHELFDTALKAAEDKGLTGDEAFKAAMEHMNRVNREREVLR